MIWATVLYVFLQNSKKIFVILLCMLSVILTGSSGCQRGLFSMQLTANICREHLCANSDVALRYIWFAQQTNSDALLLTGLVLMQKFSNTCSHIQTNLNYLDSCNI